MAQSKKGARNIVVDDVKYRWRATGTDEGILLVVWPDELSGPAIACTFDYGQRSVAIGQGRTALSQQIVVTNRIVRRVIEYAIRDHAYDARTKGKQLDLRHVDRAVDVADAIRSA